jgi:hypothetical protein
LGITALAERETIEMVAGNFPDSVNPNLKVGENERPSVNPNLKVGETERTSLPQPKGRGE